ncbi:MAG: alpha-galactosidase, partial [Eubacterium sp.]|nr:alpha-galactosidase [Eubacterium sp.]
GDWYVNEEKLPGGIAGLAEKVNAEGMEFGLWFEPEMVSPDSDLYRAHPDWCIHVPGRERTECRNQLTLDLSRKEVCDYIVETISHVLDTANIRYVKWDMNRHMTEFGSAGLPAERQKEMPHRYMLGLYDVMERIVSSHPEVLFESCSGGGGRFDPGMLYYMPQTWTSDDTDAVERLSIQYGTSLVYPVSTMGSHVSAVPNHQAGRVTSLKMRGDVAMSGNFGYELDLTSLSQEEKDIIKEQVEQYKELRNFVPSADMYRLSSPFEKNHTAWMFVSKDGRDIFAACFQVLSEVNPGIRRMKFTALDPDAMYEVVGEELSYRGDELMQIGLVVDLFGDFQSRTWRLRKQSK